MAIQVRPEYLPQRSAPEQGVYVFAYHVSIRNTGDMPTQVIARTWHIHHANGLTERVKGLGVVGYQPMLEPGEVFTYSSGCQLNTPTGMMRGSFLCITADCEQFEADIPVFVLEAISGQGDAPAAEDEDGH